MAQLICPGCKKPVKAEVPYCPTCFLTPIAQPVSVPDRTCPDPDCRYDGQPPATGCRACGVSVATSAGLEFDWGRVPVGTAEPLVVGRENSPIADRVGGYSNISRRHAEIRCTGGTLSVVDLGSMNGTFVNGERLPSGVVTEVKPGDRVRFAATLEARVTGGES